MNGFKIIETKVENCANCKGDGEDSAWIYCKTRADNDEQFGGDCGETLGCNRFTKNYDLLINSATEDWNNAQGGWCK